MTLGFACIAMLVFFFKGYNFSRLAVVAAWFCNLVLIAGWRLVARWFLHQRGREGRLRTLLVGTDAVAVDFVEQLERAGAAHCNLIGVVGEAPQQRSRPLAGRPVVGHIGELEELVNDFAIDHLVFTPSAMASFLEQPVQARNLRVSMVPVAFAEMVAERGAYESAPLPLVEIRSGS